MSRPHSRTPTNEAYSPETPSHSDDGNRTVRRGGTASLHQHQDDARRRILTRFICNAGDENLATAAAQIIAEEEHQAHVVASSQNGPAPGYYPRHAAAAAAAAVVNAVGSDPRVLHHIAMQRRAVAPAVHPALQHHVAVMNSLGMAGAPRPIGPQAANVAAALRAAGVGSASIGPRGGSASVVARERAAAAVLRESAAAAGIPLSELINARQYRLRQAALQYHAVRNPSLFERLHSSEMERRAAGLEEEEGGEGADENARDKSDVISIADSSDDEKANGAEDNKDSQNNNSNGDTNGDHNVPQDHGGEGPPQSSNISATAGGDSDASEGTENGENSPSFNNDNLPPPPMKPLTQMHPHSAHPMDAAISGPNAPQIPFDETRVIAPSTSPRPPALEGINQYRNTPELPPQGKLPQNNFNPDATNNNNAHGPKNTAMKAPSSLPQPSRPGMPPKNGGPAMNQKLMLNPVLWTSANSNKPGTKTNNQIPGGIRISPPLVTAKHTPPSLQTSARLSTIPQPHAYNQQLPLPLKLGPNHDGKELHQTNPPKQPYPNHGPKNSRHSTSPEGQSIERTPAVPPLVPTDQRRVNDVNKNVGMGMNPRKIGTVEIMPPENIGPPHNGASLGKSTEKTGVPLQFRQTHRVGTMPLQRSDAEPKIPPIVRPPSAPLPGSTAIATTERNDDQEQTKKRKSPELGSSDPSTMDGDTDDPMPSLNKKTKLAKDTAQSELFRNAIAALGVTTNNSILATRPFDTNPTNPSQFGTSAVGPTPSAEVPLLGANTLHDARKRSESPNHSIPTPYQTSGPTASPLLDLRVDPMFVKMIVEYSKDALLEEEQEASVPKRIIRQDPLLGTFVRGLLNIGDQLSKKSLDDGKDPSIQMCISNVIAPSLGIPPSILNANGRWERQLRLTSDQIMHLAKTIVYQRRKGMKSAVDIAFDEIKKKHQVLTDEQKIHYESTIEDQREKIKELKLQLQTEKGLHIQQVRSLEELHNAETEEVEKEHKEFITKTVKSFTDEITSLKNEIETMKKMHAGVLDAYVEASCDTLHLMQGDIFPTV